MSLLQRCFRTRKLVSNYYLVIQTSLARAQCLRDTIRENECNLMHAYPTFQPKLIFNNRSTSVTTLFTDLMPSKVLRIGFPPKMPPLLSACGVTLAPQCRRPGVQVVFLISFSKPQKTDRAIARSSRSPANFVHSSSYSKCIEL